jgi:hypothetical protein
VPEKPLPENSPGGPPTRAPTKPKENEKLFDRLPSPSAVGNVNENRPSPSPSRQVSGSWVP